MYENYRTPKRPSPYDATADNSTTGIMNDTRVLLFLDDSESDHQRISVHSNGPNTTQAVQN